MSHPNQVPITVGERSARSAVVWVVAVVLAGILCAGWWFRWETTPVPSDTGLRVVFLDRWTGNAYLVWPNGTATRINLSDVK